MRGNVERHADLCMLLNEMYKKKNHDYGDSFHFSYLEEGMAMPRIRLSDKLNRFKMLSKQPDAQMVHDESIKDTLLDLANYAIMTVMELEEEPDADEVDLEGEMLNYNGHEVELMRNDYGEYAILSKYCTICDVCRHASRDSEEYPCEVCVHADGNLEYFTLDDKFRTEE